MREDLKELLSDWDEGQKVVAGAGATLGVIGALVVVVLLGWWS